MVAADTSFKERPCFPNQSKNEFSAVSRVETVSSLYPLSPASTISTGYNQIPEFMDSMDSKRNCYPEPLSLLRV